MVSPCVLSENRFVCTLDPTAQTYVKALFSILGLALDAWDIVYLLTGLICFLAKS